MAWQHSPDGDANDALDEQFWWDGPTLRRGTEAVKKTDGPSPENLPYVFDRFWQRQHGNERGSGLGLALVRGIVDAQGGQVRAESTPGKGSRFSFTLPPVN